MTELDIAGQFPVLTEAATAVLMHLGPPFTDTPKGHIQTDIAASCSLSGLMILQEVVPNLDQHSPRSVVLSDTESRQEEVHRFMVGFAQSNGLNPLSGWTEAVRPEHEPLFECAEMTKRLAPAFYEAVGLIDRAYWKIVGALVGMRLVMAGAKNRILDPDIGKGLALYYVVAGSKTVPYPEALWPPQTNSSRFR